MKSAQSMWFWAAGTVLAGSTIIVAPQLLVTALFGAAVAMPDATLAIARLLGIVLVGYGVGYGVAALNDDPVFMRVSVWLRASILPALVILIALGWLPAPLLALGLLDAAGALWTHRELRRRARHAARSAEPAMENPR